MDAAADARLGGGGGLLSRTEGAVPASSQPCGESDCGAADADDGRTRSGDGITSRPPEPPGGCATNTDEHGWNRLWKLGKVSGWLMVRL